MYEVSAVVTSEDELSPMSTEAASVSVAADRPGFNAMNSGSTLMSIGFPAMSLPP